MTFVFGRSAIVGSVECQVNYRRVVLGRNQLLGICRSADCSENVRLCEPSFTGVCDTGEQLRNMGGDIVRKLIFTDQDL